MAVPGLAGYRPRFRARVRARVWVRVRVRVRVGVTELVYQIGFTTLFRSQGRENILAASKQQAAAASSSKQATELISAYPHISISIDGISPKLSW